MLEISTAGLAAEQRTSANLKGIENVARSDGRREVGPGRRRCRPRVSRIVALCTGNPYLVKVVTFISEQMREGIRETRAHLKTVSEVMDVTIAGHVVIYDSIRQKASLRVRKVMSRQISNAVARLGVTIAVDHRS